MSYDAFATTFSNSRKNLHWPELEYIIADIKQRGCISLLDVGCGNGRFLGQAEISKLHFGEYLGIDSSGGMIGEARKLHPQNQFDIIDMKEIQTINRSFDCLLFLASFHHLSTRDERIQVMQDSKKLLQPNGRIYMTNWNLRDQTKYQMSHQGDGEYNIKIGEFSRYYHAFTLDELLQLFTEMGYQVVENRIFDGGRNLLSILERES